jgi:hypothetical protein
MTADHFVIRHQDGDFTYLVEKALYHITDDGLLHCCCSTVDVQDHGFLGAPSFSLMRYPLEGGVLQAGQLLEVAHRQSDRDSLDAPSTHLFAGAYFDPWDVRLAILDVDDASIGVNLSFSMDDPCYFDERAKVTTVTCRTRFARASLFDGPDLP